MFEHKELYISYLYNELFKDYGLNYEELKVIYFSIPLERGYFFTQHAT